MNKVRFVLKFFEMLKEKFFQRKISHICDETKCRDCKYGKFLKAENIIQSGYVCKIIPNKPVSMGINGKHKDRNKDL